MITIKDVARQAEVSITTVSHVINDTRYVSDELRTKVLQAMEDLHYRPNVLARSLRRGETKTIGLIVPDNSNPFFAEVARIIEDVGFQNGYSVILCNSDGNLEKEKAYISVLIAKQVDGVIFIAAGDQREHLHLLGQQAMPVVVADRDVRSPLADVVLVDNEKGGYDAARYLFGQGHRSIACITGPSGLTPSAERVDGYRQALLEADLAVRQELVVAGDFRSESGEHATEKLLHLQPPPTAIFACNDLMAIGALHTLRRAGRQVPGDVSVIGFDDIPLSSVVSPALTTVAQPVSELATLSAQLLISRIQNGGGDNPAKRIVLGARLVIRDSCAPPWG
jgi:LacI family transcriptional regulator